MGLPLVSVVIPAYNRPQTLKIAIDSVLAQTYPNIEIIICDDSSDTRVQEMLTSYLESNPQIKYHKNERNLFLENWHKCFDLASGEYINYLMDDDVFHKQKIEKMLYYFNEFENVTLVTSYRQTINESGEFLPPIEATVRLYEEARVLDGKTLGNIALSRCLNVIGEPTTVLFRKKDLTDRYGVYKGKQYSLINDMAAWLNLLSKGKAVYIPEPLSYFRLHANQNNQTMDIKSFSQWLDIMVASREDGFLGTNELYKRALISYSNRIRNHPLFSEDMKRVQQILSTLAGVDHKKLDKDMKTKIFCIGCNKTGTTSLEKAFKDLGFTTGNQHQAELLMNDYLSGNFEKIVDYCGSAEVFQDFPFSVPGTFKHLDQAYPDSIFILTVRDDPEQWYDSITKFHSILFGNGKIPTKEDLMKANYVFKGWIWKFNRCLYDIPENDPYNKKALLNHYEKYNQEVMEYFKDRPNKLLVINLSEPDAYQRFCSFLGIDSPYNNFPWENKTVNWQFRK